MGLFNRKDNSAKIVSPMTGRVIAVTDVPDPVFSGKVLGDGVGIVPDSGEVCSPVSGTVVQIAHTKHALGIESDDGLEILVHLGVDTVKLEGEGFTCHVEVGQHVNAGDRLMDMDLEFIKNKELSTISPCIITNMDVIKNLSLQTGNAVGGQTTVMTYKK